MGGQILIDFHKRFRRGPAITAALSFGDAPVTVLFGPSGCGKTTVLRCIAGVETPGAGLIRAGAETWFDSSLGVNLRPQRRRIGYVCQDQALFPHLTVRANIAYGLSPSVAGNLGTRCRVRVDELINLFDLQELQHRRPHQLSGGQRQRIALARALAPRPCLLLLDEPFASLDAPARESLRTELRSLILRSGTPALIVTHDRNEALALGDDIAVMTGGHIRQSGPVQHVFSRPADPAIAAAVGMETVVAGKITATDDGLAEILVGRVTLTAYNPSNCRGEVLLCIRAEDVSLRRGQPTAESARNRLSARIIAMSPDGALTRITLDCGFQLTALVTRSACEELALAPGQHITALIKAPALHIIPRDASSGARPADAVAAS